MQRSLRLQSSRSQNTDSELPLLQGKNTASRINIHVNYCAFFKNISFVRHIMSLAALISHSRRSNVPQLQNKQFEKYQSVEWVTTATRIFQNINHFQIVIYCSGIRIQNEWLLSSLGGRCPVIGVMCGFVNFWVFFKKLRACEKEKNTQRLAWATSMGLGVG